MRGRSSTGTREGLWGIGGGGGVGAEGSGGIKNGHTGIQKAGSATVAAFPMPSPLQWCKDLNMAIKAGDGNVE